MFKTKTKTFIFVIEAPRDQDLGLEDYITVATIEWRLRRAHTSAIAADPAGCNIVTIK